MKKKNIILGYEFDYCLIGIASNIASYKMAYFLNQFLGIILKKQEDGRITYSDESFILISNYLYETDFLEVELVENKLVAGLYKGEKWLIPEIKQFDYFIKFRDSTKEWEITDIIELIWSIELVQYVSELNFEELKSKDNFYYDKQ